MMKIKKWRANGLSTSNECVSFMVPFIVVGGLLIAIALTLGGETSSKGLVVHDGTFWKSIENIGKLSFGFMVPILAGYCI